MNTTFKALTVAVGIFIFGFCCGIFFVMNIFPYNVINTFLYAKDGVKFTMMMERIIKPEQAQKTEVEQILNRYAKEFRLVTADGRKRAALLLKDMQTDLDNVLTEEQGKRLAATFEKVQKLRVKRKTEEQ